jgi:quinol monooxygenase YgiN
MAEPLLTVVAEIVAKPGKEEETRAALLALIAPTRQEEGFVQYDLHVATDNPAHFLFYENWTSQEMLDRHLAAPHLKHFASIAPDLLAQPVRIVTCHRIE